MNYFELNLYMVPNLIGLFQKEHVDCATSTVLVFQNCTWHKAFKSTNIQLEVFDRRSSRMASSSRLVEVRLLWRGHGWHSREVKGNEGMKAYEGKIRPVGTLRSQVLV